MNRGFYMTSMKKLYPLLPLLPFIFFFGCSSRYPNQGVMGKTFPSVSGTSLEGTAHRIPEDFLDEPVIYLIGYVQDSQFDIDRWLIGLEMTKTKVKAIELPTIQGLFPRMFRTRIDGGMRRGIPKELWGGVITIYEDGEKVQRFTGNTNPNNARVIILDAEGKIVYFYDRGFSVDALRKARAALENSPSQP